MMNLKVLPALVLFGIAVVCLAPSWNTAYDSGLKAGRAMNWAEARQDFKQAAAYRPDDFSGPTMLPGPPTERKQWRDGAPYSPNFLAAYCLYREGLAATNTTDQNKMLGDAAKEFEAIMAKHQQGREAYFLLSTIYGKLDQSAPLQALQTKYSATIATSHWKVDTEIMRPEELSQIQSLLENVGPASQGGVSTVPQSTQGSIPANQVNPITGQPTRVVGPVGTVIQLPDKFALVIGVNDPNLKGNLDYSDFDAERVRDALEHSAGYLHANIDTLTDPTADQILARARALAGRMPDSATLCIFYSGVGANINGADYLAGSDAGSLDSPSGMVKKSDLFGQFLTKSAHVFSFFQVDRSIGGTDNPFFGSDRLFEGSVAQQEATIAGFPVYSTYRNGKKTGLYTNAFVETLNDFQSNRIPILEFGWQVFNRIRRGDTGGTGGGSPQTPSLPVLSNLSSDAQF